MLMILVIEVQDLLKCGVPSGNCGGVYLILDADMRNCSAYRRSVIRFAIITVFVLEKCSTP